MLRADFLELSPAEILAFLLQASGQSHRDAVNPAEILDFLRIEHLSLDFDKDIPYKQFGLDEKPRALLAFHDRLIATDVQLDDRRARFSVLHEIAHYVLPRHEYSFYLCDEDCLGFQSEITYEKEANEFAAKLLFQGNRFALEANSHPLSAQSVKSLALKYQSSFEATARQIVEQSLRPCMLVVFEKKRDDKRIDIDHQSGWTVRYSIPSVSFAKDYFSRVQGTAPDDIAADLLAPDRDLADSISRDLSIGVRGDPGKQFKAEFFSNYYNIFCFLEPSD